MEEGLAAAACFTSSGLAELILDFEAEAASASAATASLLPGRIGPPARSSHTNPLTLSITTWVAAAGLCGRAYEGGHRETGGRSTQIGRQRAYTGRPDGNPSHW